MREKRSKDLRKFVSAIDFQTMHTRIDCWVLERQMAKSNAKATSHAAAFAVITEPVLPNPELKSVCLECFLLDTGREPSMKFRDRYERDGLE